MKVFVGLGNIGKEYDHTRHNIGFDIVDAFEQKLDRATGWKAGKGSYYFSKGWWRNEEVILVKPTTYMNLSGRAVRDVLQFYKVDKSDLVIICDDIAIPLGSIRMRLKGSDGGHNGLTSVIYELATEEFARIRCGVGAEFRRGEQARFVLSPFKASEQEAVKKMIEDGVLACQYITELEMEKAMNKVNSLGPQKPLKLTVKNPASVPKGESGSSTTTKNESSSNKA